MKVKTCQAETWLAVGRWIFPHWNDVKYYPAAKPRHLGSLTDCRVFCWGNLSPLSSVLDWAGVTWVDYRQPRRAPINKPSGGSGQTWTHQTQLWDLMFQSIKEVHKVKLPPMVKGLLQTCNISESYISKVLAGFPDPSWWHKKKTFIYCRRMSLYWRV